MNIDEIIHWLKEMQGPEMSEAELYCAGSCYGTGEMAYSSPEDYALDEAINALEQLKEYRKLEEQGRLVKFPCKDVYFIVDMNNPKYAMTMKRSIRGLTVYEIEGIDKDSCKYFSSEEKAEKKLKELRCNND